MNSMEAMASDCPQREIEVATELSGAEVVISVCDHGVGIPSAIKDRIFEPFFTTKPAGTGMGLAVCRTVVEEHEGRIWAETSNAGTAIRFTLKTSQS
jgi:signal transduction histidine kinase